jgi:hypothetical protein
MQASEVRKIVVAEHLSEIFPEFREGNGEDEPSGESSFFLSE